MQSIRGSSHTLLVLLGSLASLGSMVGQVPAYPPYPPPAARVARVQYMSGEISWAQCDLDKWSAASQNQRLTPNTCVWADKNSRAELDLVNGLLRMNSETSVTLVALSQSNTQLKVNQGTVSLSVPRLRGGEIYEIDTPNATLTVMKPGVYRVDVLSHGDQTWVTVRRGVLAASGKGPAVNIDAGQQVRFENENSLQHTALKAPAPDGFDDWAHVRDERLGVFRSGPFIVGFGPYWPGPPPPVWGPYPH
jgi:FecR protein